MIACKLSSKREMYSSNWAFILSLSSKCKKRRRASSLGPLPILIGGGRKTGSTFHTWAAHSFLVTALIPPPDASAECQGFVGCISFSCGSYTCESQSEYREQWRKQHQYGFQLAYFLLPCQYAAWKVAPIILPCNICLWVIIAKTLFDNLRKHNALSKVLCHVAWWPPITSDFELVFWKVFGIRLSTANRPYMTFVQVRKRCPFLMTYPCVRKLP